MPTRPAANDAYDIKFFRRHPDDDPMRSIPGETALDAWPDNVQAKIDSTLVAVAKAPPHKFAGGGRWEVMKGDMTGYYQAKADGPNRHHYRLFCVLDSKTGGSRSVLTIITGLDKPFLTEFTPRQYASVRALGDEYFSRLPRSFAESTD